MRTTDDSAAVGMTVIGMLILMVTVLAILNSVGTCQ